MHDLDQLEQLILRGSGLLTGGLLVYLVVELLVVHLVKRSMPFRQTRAALFGMLSQGLAGVVLVRLFGPLSVAIAATAGARLGPFDAGLGWPAWVYGLVVYEFWYWVQHWAAHKVRLLWCIHSPHHAPRGIHMAIGANHHFLEGLLYFPLFFGFIPALFGVHPLIAVTVNVVDSIWGSFLHISPDVVERGRYGLLERFMQTPSYHRAHHAKNALYIDTNYNSITLLWDWLLGTLQPLRDEVPVDYGITRDVDPGSFWDVHFGEFRVLYRDVRSASGIGERLGYLFRPPGWRPGDDSHTAGAIKAALRASTDGGG